MAERSKWWGKLAGCRICSGPIVSHGLCDKHYMRLRKYGDPHFVKKKQASSVDIYAFYERALLYERGKQWQSIQPGPT